MIYGCHENKSESTPSGVMAHGGDSGPLAQQSPAHSSTWLKCQTASAAGLLDCGGQVRWPCIGHPGVDGNLMATAMWHASRRVCVRWARCARFCLGAASPCKCAPVMCISSPVQAPYPKPPSQPGASRGVRFRQDSWALMSALGLKGGCRSGPGMARSHTRHALLNHRVFNPTQNCSMPHGNHQWARAASNYAAKCA